MSLLDLVFPKSCLSCKRSGVYVCTKCVEKVRTPKPICPICDKASIDGMTHIICKKPHGLNGLISVYKYEGVIRKAVIALKYKYAREVSSELIEKMFIKLEVDKFIFPKNAILIPIPLYWFRENVRGFNQTKYLGKKLSEKLNWKYNDNILLRKKHKTPQTKLKGDDRKKNVRGVFILNSIYRQSTTDNPPGRWPSWDGGRPLVIFDDVYTTGSTLREACKVLKRNGAKEVWGLTIAR